MDSLKYNLILKCSNSLKMQKKLDLHDKKLKIYS